jgi:predicted HicB family RNase H-like nuclease
MGKTSAAVKNKWNDKAYDRINLTVPKGDKEKIKAYAESKGKSVNGYIYDLIQKDMKSD